MFLHKNSIKQIIMADCHKLFSEFNDELNILPSKRAKMITSKNNLRDTIRDDFKENHPDYVPKFFIQGSYKTGTSIRNKEDHCDLDDGIYFSSNPDNVTGRTLQEWVLKAVAGVTDATPVHKRKCIRVNYQAGYNIDLPVMVFDSEVMEHPQLAVKDSDFKEDDPKEFIGYYKDHKTDQMTRMVKYLKSWCDNMRESMPSGLAMTVLALNHYMTNDRDDVALKFLLVEIESALKAKFECMMPTTPGDDLFSDYSETKRDNFLNNLKDFISDAKSAINEPNQRKASLLWKKHLGNRFPEGEDKDDNQSNSDSLRSLAGNSRPYFG